MDFQSFQCSIQLCARFHRSPPTRRRSLGRQVGYRATADPTARAKRLLPGRFCYDVLRDWGA